MQLKKESQQNRSDDEFGLNDAAKWILTCLSPLYQKARGKTRHESQFLLSPHIEQHLYAYSSSYSEVNVDKTLSQEWKDDELMEDRTGRFVVTSQHTGQIHRRER